MFDAKRLLKCSNKYNSYRLSYDNGLPLSTEDTVNYFMEIGLTNDELEKLNAYILEDTNHSFYDFPETDYEDYLGYDYFDMLYPGNYVSCMRYSSLLISEYSETKIFYFTRPYHEDINSTARWNIKITGIRDFGSYIKFSIYCKNNWIDVYTGLNDYGLLVSFPEMGKATMLSLNKDYEWNYNQLFNLLKDGVYADSIAEAILYLEDLIHSTYDNYD
ncbi:MAG: hypothetical protein LUG60_00005 [Erysipelotrichaceae bacterium]|nr:hypothetical protein [Erysipelotrichaceae bacterium]